jgi:general secretion pathway protein D
MKTIKTACYIFISLCLFLYFSSSPVKSAEQKISFNFVQVEIPAVIKFISEITGKNFIYDEHVKGKVTILTPSKLSVEESFTLFTSVLELKGYTVVRSGTKAYKIIPSTMARQAGSTFTDRVTTIDEAYITRLLPVQNIKADEALKFLQPIVSRNGHISSFGPSNQILIVDSALNIDKVDSILKKIDQPPTFEEPVEVNVYPLEHADAAEIATVLEGIVKGARVPKKMKGAPSPPPILADIMVTPDKSTNALIIVATPKDYAAIEAVIKELDKRRRQVFVEAMIVEASIDKVKELGTKWRATVRHDGEPVVIGGFGQIGSADIVDILTGLTGLTAGGMGNFLDVPVSTVDIDGTVSTATLTVPGFAALFDLSDFRDAINVLSTPQILTSDNEEAEIVVGENVPFISQAQRDLSTTDTVLSSVERRDVGITLRITPQITKGDYVKLDLYQEISAIKDISDQITISVGPTYSVRSTKTAVVVRDGQTVVISGLMEEREEDSMIKTPLLGDVPVLGWLFKHKGTIKEKTNLLVFVTPHIVKDSLQLAKITHDKRNEFADKEKHYLPGELLIKFTDDTPDAAALEIIHQKGASVIKVNERLGLYHIKLRPEQTVEEAVDEFSALPEVLYAEPNYRVTIQRKEKATEHGLSIQ